VEPLSGHTERGEVEGFGLICPGIYLKFSHTAYDIERREEGVWHIVLPSLEVKGTGESHKSSKETSRKIGHVHVAILLLEVFSYNKASLAFVKIPVLVKLVVEYPHQGYSIFDVFGRDIWLSKGALLPAFAEFSLTSSFKFLSECVALEFLPVTWWKRYIIPMNASRIRLDPRL
jgi:hypothetical protein